MAEIKFFKNDAGEVSKKFIDLQGLDYFWEKAQAYIDDVDADLKAGVSGLQNDLTGVSGRVAALETTVGDETSGLVKDVKSIQDELIALASGTGSIQAQIETAINALDVEDTAVADQYVSSVHQVDGKIVVGRSALPNYDNTYAAKSLETTVSDHVGDTVVHITADERASWNAAEQNAIVAGKSYTDAEITKLNIGQYATTEALESGISGVNATIAGVSSTLDAHTGNADIHVTAQQKKDWQDATDAINAFLDENATTDAVIDTLKEITEYIAGDSTAAAQLVTRVGDLEDAVEVLNGDVTTDGSVKKQISDAIAGLDSEVTSTVAEGVTSYVKVTVTEVDGKLTAVSVDDSGVAEVAKVAAEGLTDVNERIEDLEDAYIAADDALRTELQGYADQAEADAVTAANAYTDSLYTSIVFATESDIDGIFEKE